MSCIKWIGSCWSKNVEHVFLDLLGWGFKNPLTMTCDISEHLIVLFGHRRLAVPLGYCPYFVVHLLLRGQGLDKQSCALWKGAWEMSTSSFIFVTLRNAHLEASVLRAVSWRILINLRE